MTCIDMLDFKCFPWYHISSSQIEKCWKNVIEMFLIVNCHWCEKGRMIMPKLSHISIHLFPQWSSNCTYDARLKLWLNTANDSYFCYFIHFIHIYSSFSNYLQSHFKSGIFPFPKHFPPHFPSLPWLRPGGGSEAPKQTGLRGHAGPRPRGAMPKESLNT